VGRQRSEVIGRLGRMASDDHQNARVRGTKVP
jgi:hypothetical protein